MTQEPAKISRERFVRHFTEAGQSKRFCFILGAGASKSSGIPTGEELAARWLAEIKEDLSAKKFRKWVNEENIKEDESASYYPQIFTKRFLDQPTGYGYLENMMKDAQPSCGYLFLAEIMMKGKNNIVITTNFDSLTEDALFIHASEKPLIIGHSSLSGFIKVFSERSQIIKIHHDLLLSPQNTESETQNVDQKLQNKLEEIFKYYTPIVIGYGGNDGGFMDILEKYLKEKIFWCVMEGEVPKDQIQRLILDKKCSIVPITGFDELMVLIGNKMNCKLELLDQRINKVADDRITLYQKQIEEINERTRKNGKIDSSLQKETKEIITRGQQNKWVYLLRAQQEIDIERKEEIYKEGLSKFCNSYQLMNDYANFLYNVKKDYNEAESYYQKALKLNPEDVRVNGSYANFLYNVKKDYNEAENYYQKALKLNPKDARVNGSYANFLCDIRKGYDEAEYYYQKTLELNPEGANVNGNYAWSLLQQRQLDKARELKARKLIDKAFSYNQNPENEELTIELWFYRYACFHRDYPESKEQIIHLLKYGVRSPGWNLNELVRKANEMNHPEYEQVAEFAHQISDIP